MPCFFVRPSSSITRRSRSCANPSFCGASDDVEAVVSLAPHGPCIMLPVSMHAGHGSFPNKGRCGIPPYRRPTPRMHRKVFRRARGCHSRRGGDGVQGPSMQGRLCTNQCRDDCSGLSMPVSSKTPELFLKFRNPQVT